MRYLMLFLVMTLTACATKVPVGEIDPSAAIIQNQRLEDGEHAISAMFVVIDGKMVKPDVMTRGIDARYAVAPGNHNLVLQVVHGKNSVWAPGPLMEAYLPLSASLEVGHIYTGQVRVERGMAYARLLDQQTGQAVSENAAAALVPAKIGGVMLIPVH